MRKRKTKQKEKNGAYSRKSAHDQALQAATIAQENNKGKVMKRIDYRTYVLVDAEDDLE